MMSIIKDQRASQNSDSVRKSLSLSVPKFSEKAFVIVFVRHDDDHGLQQSVGGQGGGKVFVFVFVFVFVKHDDDHGVRGRA